MICGYCSRPVGPGEVVVMEQYGEVVDGVFQPTDGPSIHHEDCGDDEDDDVSPVEYFHGKEV